MATATDRIDLRVDARQKNILKKAAALSGLSLSQYVVAASVANAEQVLEKHSMTLPDDMFDQFVAACENAASPNQTLRDALKFTKNSGF